MSESENFYEDNADLKFVMEQMVDSGGVNGATSTDNTVYFISLFE